VCVLEYALPSCYNSNLLSFRESEARAKSYEELKKKEELSREEWNNTKAALLAQVCPFSLSLSLFCVFYGT
jgi:hypothetical protein